MLSRDQIAFFETNGYLVLAGHLPAHIIASARDEIDVLCAHGANITQSDEKLDLEDSHTTESPRIRRIKRPDLQSALFNELMRSELVLAPVRDLIGGNIRLHTAKLNMKSAQFGAPVQWHQDFAFYPHTNDDLLAVGIVFDDMTDENGPLQVFPGSHKGAMLDHHNGGVFAGSVDLAEVGLNPVDAVSLSGPAGTLSFHHCRILHGSALNRSARDRRMLFYEMCAADAFPVAGSMTHFESLEQYDSMMLCGETTKTPRLANVPIRIPQPQPANAGSIYEIQARGKGRDYQTYQQLKVQ